MFSDEGGVGTLSSERTRRSRPSLAGGTCADGLAAFAEAGGRRALDARGEARRAFGIARRAFALGRRLARCRRLVLGRPPDLIDFLDFRGVVAVRRFAERLRDFLFAMTASLLEQP